MGELSSYVSIFARDECGKKCEPFLWAAKNQFLQVSSFLGDPQRFSNPRINKITSVLTNLIEADSIECDNTEKYNISFESRDIPVQIWFDPSYKPKLLFNKNFLEKIQENPLLITEHVGHISSLVRDYILKRIHDSDSYTLSASRGLAYEAETLLTLIEMAKKDTITIVPNSEQRLILNRYLKGIDSFEEPLLM